MWLTKTFLLFSLKKIISGVWYVYHITDMYILYIWRIIISHIAKSFSCFVAWCFIGGQQLDKLPGPHLNVNTVFSCMGIPTQKIRRSRDHLIFNMGIPALVRRHLYTDTVPSWLYLSILFSFSFALQARNLKRAGAILDTWTFEGRVLVKDKHRRIKLISASDDLRKFQ